MHEDIANILDKNIGPCWIQPKFDKVSVKAHCKRCNTEVFTRVKHTKDCERIALWWFIGCCSLGKIRYLSDVTQEVYQHSCPQCHTVIGEFHARGEFHAIPFLIAVLILILLIHHII